MPIPAVGCATRFTMPLANLLERHRWLRFAALTCFSTLSWVPLNPAARACAITDFQESAIVNAS